MGAQIRCSIYQDRWDRRNEETYAEHYIRYASMASMLNPSKSEEDLVGAVIIHFPPAVQNDMVCGNFKATHDALAILSKMQGLETARLQHTRPRRSMTNAMQIQSRREEEQMTLQTAKAGVILRLETDLRHQSPRRFGRNGESNGWGSRWQERYSLNPRVQDFEPRTSNRE